MAAAPTLSAALGCRSLTLQAGARELVRGLDLTIEGGQRWVVLGPNGAGKSTLLAVLAGVQRAHAGAVEVNGHPIERFDALALAGQRALLADRWLDPFAATVLDTVLTSRYRFGDGTPAEVEQAIAELARLDCGHLLDHDVRTLSRGERQRVAIATAIVQDTPLLLLDEPTAHQDPRHQALVLDRLAALPARTLLVSLHDLNAAARFATHALLLSGVGSWSAGPAADVLTPAGLGALFGTPFGVVQVQGRTLFHLAS